MKPFKAVPMAAMASTTCNAALAQVDSSHMGVDPVD